MSRAVLILTFLFIISSISAKNLSIYTHIKEKEVNSSNKTVLSFNSAYDWMNMMIEDSWNNFNKLKSFANQNFGGVKKESDLIIKISDVPFLTNGRDAKMQINLNTSGYVKDDIRSYYMRVSMTFEEIEEFDNYWRPNEYSFSIGNLTIEPWELSGIGISDLSGRIRYSSVKSKVQGSDNYIFYPPYINVIITLDPNSIDRYNVTFAVSKINNSIEIEKVNAEPANQDFHRNVRRLVQAVKFGKITSSEYAGDEIKKFYSKTVLGDAYWGSFPGQRFISKIQLAGTSGSFISGNDHSFYALIRRGDKNNISSDIKNWVNYLSYALGKNYAAVKKYDQFNLLTDVSFIPVNQDFNDDPEIVVIKLETVKNIFVEDGQEELVLRVYIPLFGFSKYEDYWVPMLEIYDFI